MIRFGQYCLCRREAPRVGHFTFPVCWRCSGLLAGGLLGSLALAWLKLPSTALLPLGVVGGLATLPAALDVFCQIVSAYRSNRYRRLATGLLLGAGIVLIITAIVSWFRSPL